MPTAFSGRPWPQEPDPLHLTAIFDLSETTAVNYATLARQLLHDPTDQVPNLSGAE
ncbi:hypothetical protein [Streptomyces sp. NPDC051219]|uniref:hypothetical protein n=1 Tax=Streptomyces sp. NPDC051219 TaxID=3155283 RepID=UPI00341462F1